MLEIDSARPGPIEQLATRWFVQRSGLPSMDFCRCVAGIAVSDKAVAEIAKRLGVSISTVLGWRERARSDRQGDDHPRPAARTERTDGCTLDGLP